MIARVALLRLLSGIADLTLEEGVNRCRWGFQDRTWNKPRVWGLLLGGRGHPKVISDRASVILAQIFWVGVKQDRSLLYAG